MSETVTLRVQGNGTLQGWESVTGATYAWQAVDDSDGTTHDSDSTYLVLPRGVLPQGIVSFPLFYQCDPGQILSVTLNVAAKIDTNTPEVQIGFHKGGSQAFHGTTFTPTGSYTVASRTFTTNPITGAAWVPTDIVGMEACVKMVVPLVAKARITLISGSMSAAMPTNRLRRPDDRWVTA